MSHKSELLAGLYERTVSKLSHHKRHDDDVTNQFLDDDNTAIICNNLQFLLTVKYAIPF